MTMSIEIGTGLCNSPEGKVELDVNLTGMVESDNPYRLPAL